MITDGDQPWAPPTTTNTLQCKIQFFDEDEPCKAGEDDCATDDIDDENEDLNEGEPCNVDEDDCTAAAENEEEEDPNPQTIH